MRSSFRIPISVILIGVLLVNPVFVSAGEELGVPETASVGEAWKAPLSYSVLMRSAHELKSGESKNTREDVAHAFEQFIQQEKENLQNLPISAAKKAQYFELLDTQLQAVKNPSQPAEISDNERIPITIPEKPASFNFNNEEIQIKQFHPNVGEDFTSPSVAPMSHRGSNGVAESPMQDDMMLRHQLRLGLIEHLLSWMSEKAIALATDDFPELQDILSDYRDVFYTAEIKELAKALRHNPVQIANFIRKNIIYEPYFGAKKGSTGCLKEKVCNDVDVSSLTIALLRASGIPARYKKSIVIMPVSQLKNLLAVDETKTVYAALALNKVPVYTISGNNIGNNFDNADFSKETHLAVEWVRVEAFYDYDERGGNIDGPGNSLIEDSYKFEFVEPSKEVKEQMIKTMPKKQWIPIDALVQPYAHTANEIVADTAKFDSQQFWNDYIKYQGQFSPLEKYADDLLIATGKDVQQKQYESGKLPVGKAYEILPPTLPYYPTKGQVDGAVIAPETWSVLPSSLRNYVKVSLVRAKDKSNVLSQTFYAHEVNNVELNLLYKGATPADEKVIEKYGGIYATPATLVDIVPYLQTEVKTHETQTTVKIGEPLILQFEYLLDNKVLYTDQKLSVAGNHEGIYMALSKTQDDPSLDTDSHVLLRGNVGLARKFLQRVEAGGDVLKKSLDYEYNTVFSRAVVTQNRILSEVNGVATTFDFKGLSMDASSYINDYSNRGNYKTHRKDFRLLWGLAASHEEAKLFIDITGLDAISTVNGLQYAAANPNTYTIHTITQNNVADIDQLQLSQNTKANLKAEVAKGNTVTTPDKPVSKGVWKGILYTSIAPDGSGMYAIGEQVGNGGWSTVQFRSASYKEPASVQIFSYTVTNGNRISYQDNREADGILCKIGEPRHNELINRLDWKDEYGFPCDEGTLQFGTVSHTYIHAAAASKFYSPAKNIPKEEYGYWPGYDYWITKADVRIILERDKNSDVGVNNVNLNGLFNFSAVAGTYFHHGVGGNVNIGATVYYFPTDKSGKVVYADMRSKFDSVKSTLGFPKDGRKPADESFAGTRGFYQDFAGGQIYLTKDKRPAEIYYVPGKVAEYYNDKANAITDNNGKVHPGSGGVFGFPIGDPFFPYNNNADIIRQKFEKDSIQYDWKNQILNSLAHITEDRRRLTKAFAEKVLKNEVEPGNLTDVEAFAKIADYVATVTHDNDEFVRDLGVLLVGVEKVVSYAYVKQEATHQYSPLMIKNFSDTGFKFKYNDSHYCLAADGLSNQLYHSMGGFNIGYNWNGVFVSLADYYHEQLRFFRIEPSPLGSDGSSIEDSNLTQDMGKLGIDFRDGKIGKKDIGALIIQNFADKDLNKLRKSRLQLKTECDIRRNFRNFERDSFFLSDTSFSNWKYNEDMIFENGHYVQYYEKFGDKRNVKAIWDEIKRKILLVKQ